MTNEQLIAIEMKPLEGCAAVLVSFNRPFTHVEMNAMHRALNEHLIPHGDEPLPGAPDPRDAVIAELTKWADDWAVYRGPAEKPVDKGWRLAAEELQSILKKSATRT